MFWGAPLARADVALRGADAASRCDITAAQAGSETLSRPSAWLGLHAADTDLVEGDEFVFAPTLLDGGAISLRLPVAVVAFFHVGERPADRRPATLVGTVVLMI